MNPDDVRALVAHRLEQAQAALGDARCLLDAGRSTTSVINRSYYAMFYATLALLQRVGQTPSKHSGALGLFDREFVLTGRLPRELGRDLHLAFDLRQDADYRTLTSPDPTAARDVLARAERFVAKVGEYLGAGHTP